MPNRKELKRMTAKQISILLFLSIFATTTYAWSAPDKLMNNAANGGTAMKIHENKGALQKKWKPASKPIKSSKKRNTKSQLALSRPDDRPITGGVKKDVDFLKAVEEKKRTRWIALDQSSSPSEFLPRNLHCEVLSSREALPSESSLKPFPGVSQYFEGGTKLETLRRLESRKEEVLREIFMGLRFSFPPVSRHVVLEMNVAPHSEKAYGVFIPF